MESFIAGDKKSGEAYMAGAKPLFRRALLSCQQLNSHIADWGRRVEDMMARPDWEHFAEKVYKDNKREIERNIDLTLREWESGNYFNSGLFDGQWQKVFLDA